jgi:chromosome partitioning protein
VRAVRRKWHPTAPVIAVSNLKGGVGKTTLAAHVFSALSNQTNLSILMIDLDPQANLSQFVLPQKRLHALIEDDKSVLSLFENSLVYGSPSPRATLFSTNDTPIDRVAINDIAEEVGSSELAVLAGVDSKPVFLIAGQFELVKYTLPMNAGGLQSAKRNFLKSINAAQKEFDVIVIDLNPSSSFMIECALTAATHVLCPMRPDKYSIQGLEGMKRLIEEAYGLHHKPQIIGVFNGVPVWNSLVRLVSRSADDAVALGELRADAKISDCLDAILEVVNNAGLLSSLILTDVPETPMLRAYFEDSSAGFFSLANFGKKGRYGADLRNRLRDIAKEVATFTRAEALDVPHQR